MSALLSRYLKGLKGIEIGRGAQNVYKDIDGLNVDCPQHDLFNAEQLKYGAKSIAKIDIIADADKIPLADNSQDYIFSSHVIEHLCDPIGAVIEWYRLVKNGGYVALVIPQRDAAEGDKGLALTTLIELVHMHIDPVKVEDTRGHLTRWTPLTFFYMVHYGMESGWFNFEITSVLNPDDKVGNGFIILMKVIK